MFPHVYDGNEVHGEQVDGEHDDHGDQHLGHFPPGLQLIVQVPIGTASTSSTVPPVAHLHLAVTTARGTQSRGSARAAKEKNLRDEFMKKLLLLFEKRKVYTY